MSINKNLMNPVPLHASMDDWYDNKNTYHGRKSNVIFPTNRIPPMMLTFDNTHSSLGSVTNIGITITGSGTSRSVTLIGNILLPETGFSYTDGNAPSNNVTLQLVEVEGGYKIELMLGLIDYQVINTNSSTATTITESMLVFTESMLNTTGVQYAIYHGTTYYGILRLTTPLLYATLSSGLSTYVVNCSSSDTTGSSVSLTAYIGSVPPSHRTSTRYGWLWLGGESVTGFSSGDYFLRVTFDGTDYYGEPFSWLTSNSEWLAIAYRRSVPVVSKLNYLPFGSTLGKTMEMYIPATMIKPPYTFDSEVEDLDGWKFVQKQVSYHLHKVSFVCSQYFAEAIRLLWHCNDITISQDGETTEVDYMEPPEVDWGDDAHLCEVTLQFQSDTIVQTNGETGTQSHISSGTAYDGSFNESFS